MKHILLGLFTLCSTGLIAQNGIEIPDSTQKKSYFEIGLQTGSNSFRDFATSPLFYSAVPIGLNFAVRLNRPTHETYYGLSYNFGFYSNYTGSTSSSSIGNTLALYYQRLVLLPSVSNEKWNYKLGGKIDATANFRYNEGLQNNSVGVEMVNTLFVSGKVHRDVSRKKMKDNKILFVKYQLEPRKRGLSFQLNLGVINNNLRNGYAYIDQSAILNDSKVFGGYEYHWFEGFRMSSALDYTIYLHNANAVQVSYLWGAYHTGGDENRFEFASHTIRFSILFNTK